MDEFLSMNLEDYQKFVKKAQFGETVDSEFSLDSKPINMRLAKFSAVEFEDKLD